MRIKNWWHSWLIAADATKCLGQRALRSRVAGESPLQLNSLEDRILYSATPLDPSVLAETHESATLAEEDGQSDTTSEITTTSDVTVAQTNPSEVVIIDASVSDLDELLNDLENSERNLEIKILDRDADGVDQITELLDSRTDISALHIVSHAESGAIKLGNLWLGDSNMEGHAGAIASWQNALQEDADILLYGCNLAGGEAGQALIGSLASLTGADVAASSNDTGHSNYQADWVLEYEHGLIDHATIFSEDFRDNWHHKLVIVTADRYSDGFDSTSSDLSIRQALGLVSAGGGDTIQLLAGTYTLSVAGSNEDSNMTGDFDITSDVTIRGAGIDATVIEATVIDRIFDLIGNITVTIEDLTLRGGDSSDNDGGAIRNSNGTLNINNVRFESNQAMNGGALFNSANAVLQGVILESNTADLAGGAIFQSGSGSLQIIETTLNNNSAGSTGGGIHNEGANLNIERSTLSNNQAAGNQGGGIYNIGTEATTISNTTLSGNTAPNGSALFTESHVNITNTTVMNNNGTALFTQAGTGSIDLKNSILAMNNGLNTNQKINSLGHNIEDGFSAFEPVSGDQQSVINFNLTITALEDNGGPTKTHALLLGNPAIDAGDNLNAPAVDQRNISRDSNVDIGAFEFVQTNPTATVEFADSSLNDSNNTASVTITFSETVVGFDPADDLTVVGGTLSGGSLSAGGTIYSATFTADDDFTGTGSVTLLPGSYTDDDLNPGSGASDSVDIDTTNPVVTINLLSTDDTSPALSGTINDPTATITVTVGTQNKTATNNGDGTWILADNILNPLAAGSYDVSVVAVDPAINIGVDATSNELTITVPTPLVSVDFLNTNDTSPALSGTINDIEALVVVEIAGQSIVATNIGNGTWFVADDTISPLAEGVYDLEIRGTNTNGIVGQDSTNNELVIDTTSPNIGIDEKETEDATPSLSGTIDDPTATISLTVNGVTVSANNMGDGTWQVEDNQIPGLPAGTYDVAVQTFDTAGNVGSDSTTDELTINPSDEITLLDALSPALESKTTTAIIVDTGLTASTPVAPDTELQPPQDETTTDGNPASDSSDAATTPPPFIGGELQKTVISAFKANPASQTFDSYASSEIRITQSVFTLSEVFEVDDVYQTFDRGDFQTRSTSPRQFDGTTIDTLSRIQAIDSALLSQPGALWHQLDDQLDQVESQINGDLIIVGAAGAAASGFTVGFIAWAFRAGFLASGLIAQLPAWKAMDPTLIMQGFDGFTATADEDENSETLEEMMVRQGQAFQNE